MAEGGNVQLTADERRNACGKRGSFGLRSVGGREAGEKIACQVAGKITYSR